ncbi:MAG: hypothetical protein LQ343_006879 [Gyalolechia ehrenbergii]|nr:MAG: hypothetical protein LQ343_006879 [Gyalolechia ehrenbergii]
MTSFHKPTVSLQCLGYLRRLAGIPTSSKTSPFHGQIRGKKKTARQPHIINVRLLEDIRGYGRKGSIIPVAPGRMRNIYYPQRKAEYVTAAQMRTISPTDILAERDFNFGNEQVEEDTKLEEDNRVVDVKMKLLTMKRASELIETFVPQEMVFYKVPIANPKPEPEQPEPLGNSINAIGGAVPQQRTPEPMPLVTRIFGSVSTADMVDSIKAVLGEDEEGARVVLNAEDIQIVGEKSEELDIEEDRLKTLGDYKIEIRLKGVDPIRRTVSIRAQEEEP